MEFDLAASMEILGRTPATLTHLIRDLPEAWVRQNEGDGTWSGSSLGWKGNLTTLMFPNSWPTGLAKLPRNLSLESWLGLAYLVAAGSLLAFTAYMWLLRNAPTTLVGTYAYVNPFVAVLLGTLVLDEPLGWRTLVGGGIVIVAVALIVRAPRVQAQALEARPAAVPARGS